MKLVGTRRSRDQVQLGLATRRQGHLDDVRQGGQQALASGGGHELCADGDPGEQQDGEGDGGHESPPASGEMRGAHRCRAAASEPGEPQAVRDDKKARETHGDRRDERVEETGGGEGESRHVVPHGPAEVLEDDRIGGRCHADRGRDALEVVADQCDIARGEGHFRAAADGAAHVGGGQCGGVVDAVAHHDHRGGAGAESTQGRELLLGVQPAVGGVDGQRAGDGRDRLLAVAAQDGGAYPELVQPGDGANRLLTQGGGDGKDADRLIVHHNGHRRLPPAAEFLRPCLQLGG